MRAPEFLRAALVPLIIAGGARAADLTPQQQLESVQKDMAASRARADDAEKASAALAQEIAGLQAQSMALAAATTAREDSLTAIEARLVALANEERTRRAALDRDGQREGAMLMALLHVAAAPREAWVLGPVPREDAMRGAIVMARTVPALEAEGARLQGEIASLDATRAEETAAEARASDARQALAAERVRLGDLIAQKAALEASALQTADESKQRLLALAAEAGNLRDLIDRIDADRRKEAQRKGEAASAASVHVPPPAGPGAKPFAEAKGDLVVPAVGPVVAQFGTLDENGVPRHGLTIETRPGAVVLAPYAGEIAFAGPFRGYGQILIIAHGDGYHSLLAGLDRVDGSPGERLVAGEPVGKMPDHGEKPQLYLELRHNNQPIDPAPWLTTRLEKVNG